MSIAGGLPRAIDRARAHGCEALQIFTTNASQWRARPLSDVEIAEFRALAITTGIAPIVAHASYLINLAAGPGGLREQSIAAFGEELDRAEALGLLGVVIHPGCFITSSEEQGLRRVAEALERVLEPRRRQRAKVILELTAGQGTSLGYRFEHLAALIRVLRRSRKIGVCLDTCHLLAAGYDIRSPEGYERVIEEFTTTVGVERLQVIHLNDSKRPLGSRIDRHEHIGQGCLGPGTFERLLNDPRFARVPMLLETPKTEFPRRGVDVDPLDRMNLETLRRLRSGGASQAQASL